MPGRTAAPPVGKPWMGRSGGRPVRETAAGMLADMLRPADEGPQDLLGWTEYNALLYGRRYEVPNFYREIYQSQSRRLYVRKAAQTFASQYLIYAALWCCATAQGDRGNALYVFPAERQLGDFCRGRLDPAIAGSPRIKARLGGVDNTFQKAVGDAFLYLRGAQTQKALISVDGDLALLDEVAQYPAGTVELVDKRLSSSYLNWMRAASTPVYPSDQAGLLWSRSTQRRYHVPCGACGVRQPLEVDVNLNPETAVVSCAHCGHDMGRDRLDLDGAGEWVAENPSADWEGYQVNKLLSHRVDILNLADTYSRVLRGDVSQSGLQQFWNQDVGRPYLPEGGHVDPADLDACCSEPSYDGAGRAERCVMGVDVGVVLHVVVLQPDDRGRLLLRLAATVGSFADLNPLMVRYDVRNCVVDGEPETHAARAFATRHRGRVWLADYAPSQTANRSQVAHWNDDDRVVKVNRTMALDAMVLTVSQRQYVLPAPEARARALGGPADQSGLGPFYRHVCSPVRVISVNDAGEREARYDQNGPDHFGHALSYATVASLRSVGGVGLAVPSLRPAPTADERADPLHPSNTPIEAFFALDPTSRSSSDGGRVYSRARIPARQGGGFVTGSGRRVPATPAEWAAALALDDPPTDASDGGVDRAPDGLPPLDFSAAFVWDDDGPPVHDPPATREGRDPQNGRLDAASDLLSALRGRA